MTTGIDPAILGSPAGFRGDVPQRRRRKPSWDKWFTIVLFLAPSLVLYVWLVILPVAQGALFSLYQWNGLGPLRHFVGLDNYVRLWEDAAFPGAVAHNVIIAAAAVFVELPIALGLALLLRAKFPGRAAFRAIFFLPFVLSEVIAGLTWRFLFRPEGLLNAAIGTAVPGYEAIPWLGDTTAVMAAVSATVVWKYFGIYLVLFLAGLQDIPVEVEEAARVDGASWFQQLRYVTVPLLKRTINLSAFLTVLGAIQIFDLVWVMTQGGPVGSSETMGTVLYKTAFRGFEVGYGSAMAFVLFLVCLLFSLLQQRALRRQPD